MMTEQAEKAARERGNATPTSTQSYPVTKILLAVNTVVFLSLGITALTWTGARRLFWALMDWGPFTLGGQWWRPLTSMFMHAGLGHLLSNLLVLRILGKRAEQILGKWAYLFLYLSCGLFGCLFSVAVHPELGSLGASAGIFGLAGGLISIYTCKGFALATEARWKLVALVLWTGYNVYPKRAEVDNAAHAGGLLTGLVLGVLLVRGFVATSERLKLLTLRTAMLLLLGYGAVGYHNRYVIPLKVAMRELNGGSKTSALNAAKAALQKKPDSMLANVLAAEAYLKAEDYPNAEAAVLHALAVDHDDGHARYLLAQVKLHTGYCEEAQQIADRLIFRTMKARRYSSYSGFDRDKLSSLYKCDLAGSGDRALSEGKLDFAIAFYRQALSQEPDNMRAEAGLAKAYEAKGMRKEAEYASAKAAQVRKQIR
ncbi:MAG TPA: rhomboid family intramembrane serine protease [Candidatus Angelobacter sp.]